MAVEWLLGLAAAGGSALVGAAVNEVWTQARAGVVALFTRGGRRRQAVQTWADETAQAIEAATPEVRDDVRRRHAEVWKVRLVDLVQEYPELADDLRVWADQVRERLPAAQQAWVQTFVAREHATQYNAPQGSITVHHHSQPPPATP
ncbi:hypothetical protein [Plantactinospora sp. CA-290183]|uniref:hypothetical protein n=1 Tax=Plantactinospora sp. CA-290183 TaxID=3240006 RepID=UPI003D8D299B